MTAVNPATGAVTVKYAINGGCNKNVSTEYVSPHFLDVVDSVVDSVIGGRSGGRSGGGRGSKRKQRRCAECDGVATTRWHDVEYAEGGAIAGVVLCSDCHTRTEVAARATPPRKARKVKARKVKARNGKARNAKAARVRANTGDAVPAVAPEKKNAGGAGGDAGAGGQGAAPHPGGDDDDGGAKCAVCESGAWSAPNPILLCDGILVNGSGEEYECPGAAHLRCCGMGEVPAEDVDWLCWSCCNVDVPTPAAVRVLCSRAGAATKGKRGAAALVGQPAGEDGGALLVGASRGGGVAVGVEQGVEKEDDDEGVMHIPKKQRRRREEEEEDVGQESASAGSVEFMGVVAHTSDACRDVKVIDLTIDDD